MSRPDTRLDDAMKQYAIILWGQRPSFEIKAESATQARLLGAIRIAETSQGKLTREEADELIRGVCPTHLIRP